MPRPVNFFVQISKRLASLQVKSSKINEEINSLAALVAVEVKKQETEPAPAATSKVAPVTAPKTPVKATPLKADTAATAAPKKRGRPSKK